MLKKSQSPATNDNSPAYHTRYGIMTANEAAQDLLNRAWERLCFLEQVFASKNDGDGFSLEGYAPLGLASIIQDISIDVFAAYGYYSGEDPEPGKVHDVITIGEKPTAQAKE